jgi:diaminopropionate ammonia-lyase
MSESPAAPAALFRLWPSYTPTPLLDLPGLAARCGVARVVVKDEGRRPFGNFKTLGGMYAGLCALARAAGLPGLAALVAGRPHAGLPALLCASAGNHGLAVAAGAEIAGAAARIYLHDGVPDARVRPIAERGAEIVRIAGTYDDAVAAAERAAAAGEGLLVSDTSRRPDDPVVADVMAGYGLMAGEIVDRLRADGEPRPTHLFVQAGVGGLAASLAGCLRAHLAEPQRIVVVEPGRAACVAAGLRAGRVERLAGDLDTTAGMLACGEASAPALRILLRHEAAALAVDEAGLREAAGVLAGQGLATTESGAAGLAGLLAAPPGSEEAARLGLDADSRVLLLATESPVPGVPRP